MPADSHTSHELKPTVPHCCQAREPTPLPPPPFAGLRAGTVWVNCYNVYDAAVPFGGYKDSGVGREKGEYALQSYTKVRVPRVSLWALHHELPSSEKVCLVTAGSQSTPSRMCLLIRRVYFVGGRRPPDGASMQ